MRIEELDIPWADLRNFWFNQFGVSVNVKWNVFSLRICTFLKVVNWDIRDSKRLFANAQEEVTPSRFGNIHKWIGITLEQYWLASMNELCHQIWFLPFATQEDICRILHKADERSFIVRINTATEHTHMAVELLMVLNSQIQCQQFVAGPGPAGTTEFQHVQTRTTGTSVIDIVKRLRQAHYLGTPCCAYPGGADLTRP
ncbi:hypothetical protein Pelo_4078 [Pelomyxa schiedti]|nr:hypothetical protein Pelo_4078 [Pelomyxa schiedti]